MKEKDSSWDECCFNSHAISISADRQKAKSLIETAKAKMVIGEIGRLAEERLQK